MMEANLQKHNDCAVLRVSGDMRLWDHEADEHQLLKALPEDMAFPGGRLVLALSGLSHIDSLGITVLVKIVILCTRKKVGICTVLPGGTAGQSIRSTRIFAAWPEFKNESEALSQFPQHVAS